MEGKITAPNMEIAVNMTTMHNKAWRMDIELMSMKGWMILRPDSGWVFMPFQGQTTPDAMTPDAIKEQLDQLDLESTLCNFKEKGHSVEYLGMDDVEGTECFKLKTITKSGNTQLLTGVQLTSPTLLTAKSATPITITLVGSGTSSL